MEWWGVVISNARDLERDMEDIERALDEKNAIREKAIYITRNIIKAAGEVVKLTHRGDIEGAGARAKELAELVNELKSACAKEPEIYYSGLIYNALSEYVEAMEFYSIVTRNAYIPFSELGVPIAPFVQGLGDLIGELKRHAMELLDEGRLEEARGFISLMEELRDHLRKLELYPDALLPGLRHKIDVANKLIEDIHTLYLYVKSARSSARQE